VAILSELSEQPVNRTTLRQDVIAIRKFIQSSPALLKD
jgi:hypothetical protein